MESSQRFYCSTLKYLKFSKRVIYKKCETNLALSPNKHKDKHIFETYYL